MQKTIAHELQEFAEEIARRYSNTNRVGNVNNESFEVQDVIPMSDHAAVINFCYYINRGASKGWKYFFPTDSHVSGFQAFFIYKTEAERKNYSKNF